MGAALGNKLYGVSDVPLPAALPLFASGLVGLGLLGRRRKRSVFDLTEKAPGHCPWGFVGACQNGEGVRRELHLLIAFDRRGRMDHLEMAGEGREGVGTGVAFSARRSKL